MSKGSSREPRTRPLANIIGQNASQVPFAVIPNRLRVSNEPLFSLVNAVAADSDNPKSRTEISEDAICTWKMQSFGKGAYGVGIYFARIGHDTFIQPKVIASNGSLHKVCSIGTHLDPDAYRLAEGKQLVQGIEAVIRNNKVLALSIMPRWDVNVHRHGIQTNRGKSTPTYESSFLYATPWNSFGRAIPSLMVFAGFAIARWGTQNDVALPYTDSRTGGYRPLPENKHNSYTHVSCPIQRIHDRYASHQFWNRQRSGAYSRELTVSEIGTICEFLDDQPTRQRYKSAQHPLIAASASTYPLARDLNHKPTPLAPLPQAI